MRRRRTQPGWGCSFRLSYRTRRYIRWTAPRRPSTKCRLMRPALSRTSCPWTRRSHTAIHRRQRDSVLRWRTFPTGARVLFLRVIAQGSSRTNRDDLRAERVSPNEWRTPARFSHMIPHTPIRPPQPLARSLVVGSDEGLFLVVVENDDLVPGQRGRSPGSTFPVGGIRFQLLAPQQLTLQVERPQPEVPDVYVTAVVTKTLPLV